MELISLFPKFLGVSHLNITDDEYNMVMKTIQGTDFDTYISDLKDNKRYTYDFLGKKNIVFLKKKIILSFNEYIKEAYGSVKQEYQMTNSWLKIFFPNQNGHFHQHRNSMISGIYYPEEISKGQQGDLILYDTSSERTSYFVKRDDGVDMESFYVRPLKNRVVFFPSSIFHSVNSNLTGKTRFSIAFNFVPTGPTGEHDSYMDLR